MNKEEKENDLNEGEKEEESGVFEPANSDPQCGKVIINQTICPLCDSLHVSVSQLHKHIEDVHNDIDLKFQKHNFENVTEFHEWKTAEESKTVICFRSILEAIFSELTVSYYFCHRSGPPQSKDDRKRKIKCMVQIKLVRHVLLL